MLDTKSDLITLPTDVVNHFLSSGGAVFVFHVVAKQPLLFRSFCLFFLVRYVVRMFGCSKNHCPER